MVCDAKKILISTHLTEEISIRATPSIDLQRPMARSLEPLVVEEVIENILNMFNLVAEFTVHYGSKQIANGCEIKPYAAVQMPHVQILGS